MPFFDNQAASGMRRGVNPAACAAAEDARAGCLSKAPKLRNTDMVASAAFVCHSVSTLDGPYQPLGIVVRAGSAP
jgi:hypothetical protein